MSTSTSRRGYWHTADAVPTYVRLPCQFRFRGHLLNKTGWTRHSHSIFRNPQSRYLSYLSCRGSWKVLVLRSQTLSSGGRRQEGGLGYARLGESSPFSVSSPANGSSWYGLTSEEYLALCSSDNPLSKATEETEETALPSAIERRMTCCAML